MRDESWVVNGEWCVMSDAYTEVDKRLYSMKLPYRMKPSAKKKTPPVGQRPVLNRETLLIAEHYSSLIIHFLSGITHQGKLRRTV
jgi:hypothetical protein